MDTLRCPSPVECFRPETAEATYWVEVLRASYALPLFAVFGWLHAAVISLRVPLPSALACPSCPGILPFRQPGILEAYTSDQLATATKGASV